MARRQIRTLGDDILRKKCREVKDITPSVITLMEDMAETMYESQGVGLAAPQVGILKRIVVIDTGEKLYEMINPKIVETRGSSITDEACLSLPGRSEYVERPEYVKAVATDRNGNQYTVEGEGLLARAICHELDHLDGVLYIDKAIDESELEDIDVEQEG